MNSDPFDLFTLVGAVVQVALFVLFGRWVNQRQDYYVFRRWRAAMFIASIMILVLVGGIPMATLVVKSQAPGWQWSQLLANLWAFAKLVPLLACFIMPFVFLIMLAFYSRIMRSSDVELSRFEWLDRLWPPPDAAAGPPPIIREERFR